MALTKVYNRINWENEPSIRSPLNETNMNLIDYGLDEVDNRIIAMDTTKMDKVDSYNFIKEITFDSTTGEFIFTRANNTQFKINTKLEKLAVNFSYDYQSQELIINLDDGTEQRVDLSDLLSQYDFIDSSTIKVLYTGYGNQTQVKLDIIDGSITANKLQPNYLSDLNKVKDETLEYAKLSKSWAQGETLVRADEATNNAKYWAEVAQSYAGVVSNTAINYRGDFDPAMSYNANDACYYEGSTWVAKTTTSNPPTEGAEWRYLARGVFKQAQYLNKAAYDSLPTSKYTDDVVYFVQ